MERVSGGYIPYNHRPHDPQAIKKWMESLPAVYDLEAARKADAKFEYLKTL
jgi:hypothetical protein